MSANPCMLFAFSALAMLAALPATLSAQEKTRAPNIVFIMADDLGINDLGCYGRKDQPTPNLDKLARAGMRFASAYAAASVCSPTRAAIMTGMAPARLKLTTFLPTYLREVRHLSVLGSSGYLAVIIVASFCGCVASGRVCRTARAWRSRS